jgi:hypothetical protein
MDEKELLGADIFLASEYVAIFQYIFCRKNRKKIKFLYKMCLLKNFFYHIHQIKI